MDANELAERVAYAMLAAEGTGPAWGIRIDEARAGYCRLSMDLREDMLNGHGIAHGGIVFALADTAFAYVCNGRNEKSVAAQASIVFLDAEDHVIVRRYEENRRPHPLGHDTITEAIDAESLALVLERMGHEVELAHDGRSALDAAQRRVPEIVLLDLDLPRLDGYEVVERLRGDARFRRLRIVALTGLGRERDRARTREAGFDEHLVKPVDPDRLRELVEGALAA